MTHGWSVSLFGNGNWNRGFLNVDEEKSIRKRGGIQNIYGIKQC